MALDYVTFTNFIVSYAVVIYCIRELCSCYITLHNFVSLLKRLGYVLLHDGIV